MVPFPPGPGYRASRNLHGPVWLGFRQTRANSRNAQDESGLTEAARLGIESEYIDARGRQRTVAPEVIEKLVLALREGAGGATLAAARRSARRARPGRARPASGG